LNRSARQKKKKGEGVEEVGLLYGKNTVMLEKIKCPRATLSGKKKGRKKGPAGAGGKTTTSSTKARGEKKKKKKTELEPVPSVRDRSRFLTRWRGAGGEKKKKRGGRHRSINPRNGEGEKKGQNTLQDVGEKEKKKGKNPMSAHI